MSSSPRHYIVIRVSGRTSSGKTEAICAISDYAALKSRGFYVVNLQGQIDSAQSFSEGRCESNDAIALRLIEDWLEERKDIEEYGPRIAFIYETIDP